MNELRLCTKPDSLRALLAALPPLEAPDHWLKALVDKGFDQLPSPGEGATLDRWVALAAVAEFDLSLAKLYEGHTDAIAVLHELSDFEFERGARWGMWAAEAPSSRTIIACQTEQCVFLTGRKSWCSGASAVTHGLLTAWRPGSNEPQLVWVAMGQAGITVNDEQWHAVGMRASASVDVSFNNAVGHAVGREGDYLSRPGFWQGGAGIAACWYGGARMLARRLHKAVGGSDMGASNPFRLAALGAVDATLGETAALMRESAAWIDANPSADARACALRARACAERCAAFVLCEVGRAMGATPFCRDSQFAQMAADLPVFIRQSHAERDLAALGNEVRLLETPWNL